MHERESSAKASTGLGVMQRTANKPPKRGLRYFALLRSPCLRRIRPGHRPRLPLARHLLWVLHAALEEEGAPLARAREQHGLARGAVGIVAHAVRLGGLAARAARDERAALQHRLLPLGERGGGVGRSAAERREGTVVEALAQQRAQ